MMIHIYHRNKYNAVKVKEDGYTFDSRAEASRYKELKMLQMAGEISDLVVHPSFILFDKETVNEEKLPAIKYTADFEYRYNNEIIVEDVKGMITRDAALRIAIFKRLYRQYKFSIIKRR